MFDVAEFPELKASVVRSILVRRLTLGVFTGVALAVLIASRLLRREELATGGEVPLPRLFGALSGRGERREEA